jgi:hypothetical protein
MDLEEIVSLKEDDDVDDCCVFPDDEVSRLSGSDMRVTVTTDNKSI